MRYLLLPVLFLLGCPGDKVAGQDSGVDSPDGSTDADGDGYATPEDCDDTDPGVNPGADEICDGMDQDCDGLVDDDPVDGQSWYADADGDSYGDPNTAQLACDGPAGTVASNTDCDDGDPGVNPGATEVCDGVDQDCDGVADDGTLYGDADGDGYGDADTSYALCDAPSDAVRDDTDCDDTDSGVHPGASETWYDGEDTDCVGDDDYDADGDGHTSDSYGGDDCDDTDAESRGTEEDIVELGAGPDCGTMVVGAMVYGEAAEDEAGLALSGGGDFNGDGVDDLLVGAPYSDAGAVDGGSAYLTLGPILGAVGVEDASARVVGVSAATYTGSGVLGPGDLDGDGYSELVVQSYNGTTGWPFYVFNGPLEGVLSLTSYDESWSPETVVAHQMVSVGDVNGDGLSDILQAYDTDWSTSASRGAVLLAPGTVGDHTWSEAGATFEDDVPSNNCPYDMDGAGDLDGDGYDEVIIGCDDIGVNIFSGPLAGAYVVADSDAQINSRRPLVAGAGDTNGDGYDDIIVSESSLFSEVTESGAVFLYQGPLSGAIAAEYDSVAVWAGSYETGYVSRGTAGVDLDDSGYDDIIIETMESRTDTITYGLLFVLDPTIGWHTVDGGDWRVDDGGRQLGLSDREVAVGDVNGDGQQDLGFNEPRASIASTWDGAVWLLFGGLE